MRNVNWVRAGAALALGVAVAANAETISDPAGDFLPTYTGARTGDLDVLRAGVTFDGTNFVFSSVQNGAVGTTPTGFYVWGIDRGQGTGRFGLISGTGTGGMYDARGVVFDSVLAIRPNGTSSVTDLTTATPSVTNLMASSISVDGNELRAVVSASLLPSRGLAFEQYGFNLWPRDAAAPAGNGQISDFAPDNSNFRAGNVPEPTSWALLALGGLMMACSTKKRAA